MNKNMEYIYQKTKSKIGFFLFYRIINKQENHDKNSKYNRTSIRY